MGSLGVQAVLPARPCFLESHSLRGSPVVRTDMAAHIFMGCQGVVTSRDTNRGLPGLRAGDYSASTNVGCRSDVHFRFLQRALH